MNKALIEHLRGLGTGEITPLWGGAFGICDELVNLHKRGCISSSEMQHCSRLMQDWPEFSGDPEFPVPSADSQLNEEGAFLDSENLWSGKYGDNRKQLCLWLADQLEKEGYL